MVQITIVLQQLETMNRKVYFMPFAEVASLQINLTMIILEAVKLDFQKTKRSFERQIIF